MLRRLVGSIALALVAVFLFSYIALAAWEFMFPTTITDTSSSSRPYYPVMLGFGGQVLVDASKISANGTNTNMQIGGTDIKYMMSTTNVTAVIPYLPASGMVTANLYTGYSPPQNWFPIITGSGGYVTVADNSSMEFGNNSTISTSGYINTDNGTTKNIVYKSNAVQVYVSGTVSGNVTATANMTANPEQLLQSSDLVLNGVGASNYRASQRVNGFYGTITEVKWYLKKAGLPTGTATVNVRSVIGDGVLGTVGTVNVATLGAGYAWVTFNSTPVTVSPATDVRITIEYSGTDGLNATIVPDGAGDETFIQTQTPGAGAHWDKCTSSDAGATTVDEGRDDNTWYRDLYTMQDPAGAGTIDNVQIHIVCFGTSGAVSARTAIKIDGAAFDGASNALGAAWVDYSTQYNANPAGGSWDWADMSNLQGGVSLHTAGVAEVADCTYVYVYIDYNDGTAGVVVGYQNTDPSTFGFFSYYSGAWTDQAGQDMALDITFGIVPSVTVTSVLSGLHTIVAWADGATWYLSVNGTAPSSASTFGGYVNDNGNPWLLFQGNVMPYADNITLSVNGTPQLYLAPLTMITGATVPDRSGQTHHGTITWGANSGLSISYGGMTSNATYTASSANATGGFDMPSAPVPSSWFATGGNVSALPFYDSFVEVSVQTGTPVQTLYGIAIIGVAFGAFIGLVSFTRSALLGYIAMVIVFGIGSSMTIIPAWIVFSMVIVGAGIMYLYRQVAY
jgi:hypothetical protein